MKLDDKLNAKICDFGLIKTKQNALANFTYANVAWSAPEYMDLKRIKERVGIKGSVYSFGVIVWEMVTRQIPWEGLNHFEIRNKINDGNRLAIPENCNPELRKIMQDCWQYGKGLCLFMD